jgi:hypothetical protein
MTRVVTEEILAGITREREVLYLRGATALIQQELHGQNKLIYRKPTGSWDWSWDRQAERRIRAGKAAKTALVVDGGARYYWDRYELDTPKERLEVDADVDAGPWPPEVLVREEASLPYISPQLPDIRRK